MALMPCRQPGCPELVRGRYCAPHTRQVEGRYRERGQRKAYGTRRWRLRSQAFLVRNPRCSCGELAIEVDHVTPVEDGGGMWDEGNWQGMCHRCHSAKTNQDVRRRTFK